MQTLVCDTSKDADVRYVCIQTLTGVRHLDVATTQTMCRSSTSPEQPAWLCETMRDDLFKNNRTLKGKDARG